MSAGLRNRRASCGNAFFRADAESRSAGRPETAQGIARRAQFPRRLRSLCAVAAGAWLGCAPPQARTSPAGGEHADAVLAIGDAWTFFRFAEFRYAPVSAASPPNALRLPEAWM